MNSNNKILGCFIGLFFLVSVVLSQIVITIWVFALLKIVSAALFAVLIMGLIKALGPISGTVMKLFTPLLVFVFYFCFGLMASIAGKFCFGRVDGDRYAMAFRNLVTETFGSVVHLGAFFGLGESGSFLEAAGEDWNKPFLAVIVIGTFIWILFRSFGERSRSNRLQRAS